MVPQEDYACQQLQRAHAAQEAARCCMAWHSKGLHLVFESRLLLLHGMLDLLCIRLVPVPHLMPARLEPVFLNNMGLHDISAKVRCSGSTETASTALQVPLEMRDRCLSENPSCPLLEVQPASFPPALVSLCQAGRPSHSSLPFLGTCMT